MKIMYNGKIVDTNDMKVLGGNFEGMVYEYNGSALKVYHQNPDNRHPDMLNLESA